MRLPVPILAVCSLAGFLPAQDLRLVDRVPAPLAYLSVAADTVAADTVAADTDAAGQPAPRAAGGLEALLDDPTLGHLLAADDADPDREPTLIALRRLRDLLVLSTGELELVLNGLLPRQDAPALPLLLARVRLSDDGRDRLEAALTDPAVATPGRTVGAERRHRVYELSSESRRRPGSRFEVCLVGRDLLVSNHESAIEDVLRPVAPDGPVTGSGVRPDAGAPAAGRAAGGTAAPQPDSLGADPAFEALRARLDVGPGTAFVHLDWRRLSRRDLEGLDADGGRALLLRSVGLLAADRIALAIRPAEDALITTIVVDQPGGRDGLLAVARPASLRKLVQELPGHGLASVVFSIDPRALGEAGDAPHATFHRGLVGGCRRFGIDFDRDVLPMLGDSAAARLVLLQDDGRESAVAFALRARSAAAARALVGTVRESLERRQVPVEIRGRGDREVVVVDGFVAAASLGAVGDTVVFGAHADVVERVAALDREHRRERARSVAATHDLLERLVDARGVDARAAIGVLEVDGRELAPSTGGGSTDASDRRSRHAGLIVADGDGIRVELISSR